MSLAKKSFSAAIAAPFVLAFGLAATNAQAEVDFGCRKPADVPALQQQVLKEEGMAPLSVRPLEGIDGKYRQETIMMNPETRKGLFWIKSSDGGVCIYRSFENGHFTGNNTFDQSAFLQIPGKNPRDIPANLRLAAISTGASKENPMFRADVYAPTNAAKSDPLNYPVKYIEIMSGNPVTQSGTLTAASFDGRVLDGMTKAIPAKGTTSFAFGATYTPAGLEYLQKKMAAAPATGSQQLALNKP